jgi:hypothetical protein
MGRFMTDSQGKAKQSSIRLEEVCHLYYGRMQPTFRNLRQAIVDKGGTKGIYDDHYIL